MLSTLTRRLAICSAILFLLSSVAFCADGPTLSIVNAGIYAKDGGPLVAADYEFMPGDTLHLTFQIAGFAIDVSEQNETRSLAVSYAAVPQDAQGVALTVPESGKIAEQLSEQDKNWQPLRRASFAIPEHISAGVYAVHITADDLTAKTHAVLDLPFRVGGSKAPTESPLTVMQFQWFREAESTRPLDVAAFRPGDTAFGKFNIVGFGHGPKNEYDLSYGVSVKGPDGKPFADDPDTGKLVGESFYPAQVLPGDLAVVTKAKSVRGSYLVTVTVHDNITNQTATSGFSFSLE